MPYPKFKLAFLLDSNKHVQQRRLVTVYVKLVHKEIHSSNATEPTASGSSHSLSDRHDVDSDYEKGLYTN